MDSNPDSKQLDSDSDSDSRKKGWIRIQLDSDSDPDLDSRCPDSHITDTSIYLQRVPRNWQTAKSRWKSLDRIGGVHVVAIK